MAAALDTRIPSGLGAPRVIALRDLRASDLEPVLAEETHLWAKSLNWDFRASANLVRRFLDIQSLNGFALSLGPRVIGYSYYVCEDHKGLIGDLYVAREFASCENEMLLLAAILNTLKHQPGVRRVESQLLMLLCDNADLLPYPQTLHIHERHFMEIPINAIASLPPASLPAGLAIDAWSERRQDDAASLIADSYRGHIDSNINDQYRSPGGARKFLLNIVQFPGCGAFFQPASFLAVDTASRRIAGMCLSSLISPDTGHITQVCVAPAYRGAGIGYELLRHSLTALSRAQCTSASLTVTAANFDAVRVYEKMGFAKVRDFSAHVWDGF